jgi:hypothetical protein
MAAKDFRKAEPGKTEFSETEATQGRKLGINRYILLISFILAVIAMFLVYLVF